MGPPAKRAAGSAPSARPKAKRGKKMLDLVPEAQRITNFFSVQRPALTFQKSTAQHDSSKVGNASSSNDAGEKTVPSGGVSKTSDVDEDSDVVCISDKEDGVADDDDNANVDSIGGESHRKSPTAGCATVTGESMQIDEDTKPNYTTNTIPNKRETSQVPKMTAFDQMKMGPNAHKTDKKGEKKPKVKAKSKREMELLAASNEPLKIAVNNLLFKIKDLPRDEQIDIVLQQIFKLNSFREGQRDIINATLDRKDCMVIMPTGGGKSLTYQLPAIVDRGLTLVICPLLALIQNQVDAIQSLGIEAHTVNSSIGVVKRRFIMDDLRNHSPRTKILFVTPELLATDGFQEVIVNCHKFGVLKRLVVDEAHCISEWGHGFRNDYTKLGWFKVKFPDLPVLALTATANTKVKNDIINQLHMSDCKNFATTFSRPNLYYGVKHVNGDFEKKTEFKNFITKVIENRRKRFTEAGTLAEAIITDNGEDDTNANEPIRMESSGNSESKMPASFTKASELTMNEPIPKDKGKDIASKQKKAGIRAEGVCGIIYCHKRADCEEVCSFLTTLGLHAASYHGGVPNKKREEILKRWCECMETTIKDPLDIVVATISFGMGIDKANVRFVFHWTLSKTMEGYYQESGRAGRDNKISRCMLFYSRDDKRALEHHLNAEYQKVNDLQNKDSPDYVKSKLKNIEREGNSLKSLIKYCESSTKCRHAMLTDYFLGTNKQLEYGKGDKKKHCDKKRCDVCDGVAKSPSSTSKSVGSSSYIRGFSSTPGYSVEPPSGPLKFGSMKRGRSTSTVQGKSSISYGDNGLADADYYGQSAGGSGDASMDYGVGGGVMRSMTRGTNIRGYGSGNGSRSFHSTTFDRFDGGGNDEYNEPAKKTVVKQISRDDIKRSRYPIIYCPRCTFSIGIKDREESYLKIRDALVNHVNTLRGGSSAQLLGKLKSKETETRVINFSAALIEKNCIISSVQVNGYNRLIKMRLDNADAPTGTSNRTLDILSSELARAERNEHEYMVKPL